jgi:hypothetical protein
MRTLLAIAALIVLAALCGCGGDENKTTPAAVLQGLGRAAFVDKADRICVQGRKRLILTGNRAFGDLAADKKPSDVAVTAFAKSQAIPILTRQYQQLRELRPPAQDSKRIERILDLADQGIEQLRSDPTLLNRGSGVPPALQRARQQAFLYGLGACGQPIQRPAGAASFQPKGVGTSAGATTRAGSGS